MPQFGDRESGREVTKRAWGDSIERAFRKATARLRPMSELTERDFYFAAALTGVMARASLGSWEEEVEEAEKIAEEMIERAWERRDRERKTDEVVSDN